MTVLWLFVDFGGRRCCLWEEWGGVAVWRGCLYAAMAG